mgnify:CR=1 FL=1
MTFHALVVDDNQDVLEEVQDRLDSMGHTCEVAETQNDARRLLDQGRFSYGLFDLEIPVRFGSPTRIGNGKNLVREVRSTQGFPVIVMTAHGRGDHKLAVEVMKYGANDFVQKPFSESDPPLERVIEEVLRGTGRDEFPAMPRPQTPGDPEPRHFDGGELVFYPTRVELCGVKICGDEDSSVIRKILDVLHGGRAHSGEELADIIGSEGGAPAVAGAIRNFRQRVRRTLLAEAGVEIDPASDLIVNDRQHGYRFSDKLTVVECKGLLSVDCESPDVSEVVVQDESDETSGDSLSFWILGELKRENRIRKSQIIARTGRSSSMVRRALAELRDGGKIVFEGSAKTGHWRLA